MSWGGVELLFRVFADRYERGSILITSNLPFSEWGQIFQGERMTPFWLERSPPMADVRTEPLKAQFRRLRLPTMSREFDTLARDAASTNQCFAQLLLRLTELELASRAANAVASRIKQAEFPVEKDFDTYDFSALPGLSRPKVLELARCEWIEQKSNCCLVGSHGTGKTHLATAWGL